MHGAIATIRELKNKDTGVDLNIPTYSESKGFISNTVVYHVVVVSNLSCFKLPSHRSEDVVQFMISKHYEDFEMLHKHLALKFPCTALPPIPKSLLGINEATVRLRQAALEEFLRFVAATRKLATCAAVLEFLGVNPVVAINYRVQNQGRSHKTSEGEERGRVDKGEKEEREEEVLEKHSGAKATPATSLFDDDIVDDDDALFKTVIDSRKQMTSSEAHTSFEENSSHSRTPKLFAEQDLQEQRVDPKRNSKELIILQTAEQEEEERGEREGSGYMKNLEFTAEEVDLLNIDDNYDHLLKKSSKNLVTSSSVTSASKVTSLPSQPQKPVIKPKPKFGGATTNQIIPLPTKNQKGDESLSKPTDSSVLDIAKYIQDQQAGEAEDLDLFS